MDPHNDIMPHSPAPESEAFNWRNLFKPENLSLALASFAAILALAPYVVPQVQTYMIRQGLVHHPELLKETIDALQAKQMADQQKTFQAALKTNQHLLISPDDPIIGNDKSPITLVEFQDYYCGYCRAIAPEVEAVLKEYPNIHLVVKEFPVIGPNSPMVAALALAARKTGHYAELHHTLYNTSLKTPEDLRSAFTKSGLDYDVMLSAAKSPEIQDQINRNLTLGSQLGFNATPMFVINGTVIPGASATELRRQVDIAEKHIAPN